MKSIRPVLPLLDEAAALAMQFFRRHDLRGERKYDGSLVTEADQAIDELLVDALAAEYPEAAIISEERTPADWRGREFVILLDPIDGTSAFASGAPGFCVALGVLKDGKPAAGAVLAPAWGSTWMCDLDPESPAYCDGRPLPLITSDQPLGSRSTVLVDSKIHRRFDLVGYPGRCRSFGSTALHVCLAAGQPTFSVAHTGRVRAWDLVGAQAIAERVGLRTRTRSGVALDYLRTLPDGLIQDEAFVGLPHHVDAFAACLKPRA